MNRFGTLWGIVFRVVIGGLFFLLGARGFVGRLREEQGTTGPWFLWLICAGIGAWTIVSALRTLQSPESRAKRLGVGPLAIGRPIAPAMPYRSAALGEQPTARDAYALALPTLPLRLLPFRKGRELPHALRIESRAGAWVLLGFSVVWNGVTLRALPAVVATERPGLIVFMSVFVIAGVAIAALPIHMLLGRSKLARVEIGAEPMYVGDELFVFVEQRGPVAINRITATLKCEERASYTVGTDTKTATHVVHEQSLFEEEMINMTRGNSWSRRVSVTLPDGPCSFKASKNEVVWMITLDADISNWPNYKESFELRVLPRVTQGGAA